MAKKIKIDRGHYKHLRRKLIDQARTIEKQDRQVALLNEQIDRDEKQIVHKNKWLEGHKVKISKLENENKKLKLKRGEMLASLEKMTGVVKRIYGIGVPEFWSIESRIFVRGYCTEADRIIRENGGKVIANYDRMGNKVAKESDNAE